MPYNREAAGTEADMKSSELLARVELFEGLSETEIEALASVCQEQTYSQGDEITRQGKPGDELFIVMEGFVEVNRSSPDGEKPPRTMVRLGTGQIFGEMALVDHGRRSATVIAASDNTRILAIHRHDFERLCDANHHLGYVVMRNIAADLSFKVRHLNLTGR
jgi:CRP-like cAMP-binding protein